MRQVLIGYHGCDRDVALRIVTRQAIPKFSRSAGEWLGHGFYFWEDDPDRAMNWPVIKNRRQPGAVFDPAVLGAVIDVSDCLNLVQMGSIALVREAYARLSGTTAEAGELMPENRGDKDRRLDCAVFETLHELRSSQGKAPFGSVRAFFQEGDEAFPGSGIRQMDHIQICVRDLSRVIGWFLV